MKKTMLLAAMFMFTLTGFTQNHAAHKSSRTPEERATLVTTWIDKTVQLTPDQKTKVQAVNLKYAQMKQDAATKDQGNREEMRKDIMADSQEQDAELKGILTADQYTAYTAAKEQKKEDMRQRRKATQ